MRTYNYKAAARVIDNTNGANKPIEHFYPVKLKPEQRRIFTMGLKASRPDLADFLKNDTFIAEVREKFGAMVCFDLQDAREIYREGLQLRGEVNNDMKVDAA
jgi:hypothetical protein